MLGALPPRSRVQRAEKSHKTSSGLCSLPPPSAPRVCPAWASGARRHRHPTTDSAIVSLRVEVNVSESASKAWTREAKRQCGLLAHIERKMDIVDLRQI